MLKTQRLDALASLVAEQGTLTVDDACRALDISAATARRDFDELSQAGKLRRIRGGAQAITSLRADTLNALNPLNTLPARAALTATTEGFAHPFEAIRATSERATFERATSEHATREQSESHTAESHTAGPQTAESQTAESQTAESQRAKQLIAQTCLTLVHPGDHIGLTGGTTAAALAFALTEWANEHSSLHHNAHSPVLTVVTNALDIAYICAQAPGIRVVMPGGVVNATSLELVGPIGADSLNKFSLDTAFLGVNGFDASGPGTSDEHEANINRVLANRATKAVIIADSTKFGRRSFYTLGGPDLVSTIITDTKIDPAVVDDLQNKGYSVLVSPTTA